MRNLEMFIVAGVAMLLMCCQRGEGRSNTQPQFAALEAAPSHTSARLHGLADLRRT